FPDDGGNRPYLIGLLTAPPSPGLDATASDAINMDADKFPGWQPTNSEIVDSMTSLNGLLYVTGSGGIMMATNAAPHPYGTTASHWANSTPSSVVFTGKSSRPTPKLADIFPSDRAFPQMAVLNGHIF